MRPRQQSISSGHQLGGIVGGAEDRLLRGRSNQVRSMLLWRCSAGRRLLTTRYAATRAYTRAIIAGPARRGDDFSTLLCFSLSAMMPTLQTQ